MVYGTDGRLNAMERITETQVDLGASWLECATRSYLQAEVIIIAQYSETKHYDTFWYVTVSGVTQVVGDLPPLPLFIVAFPLDA